MLRNRFRDPSRSNCLSFYPTLGLSPWLRAPAFPSEEQACGNIKVLQSPEGTFLVSYSQSKVG